MLLAHGLVVSGLPLPIAGPPTAGSPAARRLAAKERARPFPCMDKPCGCSTAEQCFASCCCNSPAELLAWAKAHGLEPAMLAALERRALAADADATSSSCCAAASCAVTPAAAAIDVCDDYRSLATRPAADAPAGEERSADNAAAAAAGTRMASFTAMLACQGVLKGFMAATTALPPPSQCSAARTMPLVGRLVICDDLGSSVVIPGDPPPPRS
ncbi:MAG: hypothetical protein ACKO40_15765 [Planctomycetaceae bacterium]